MLLIEYKVIWNWHHQNPRVYYIHDIFAMFGGCPFQQTVSISLSTIMRQTSCRASGQKRRHENDTMRQMK